MEDSLTVQESTVLRQTDSLQNIGELFSEEDFKDSRRYNSSYEITSLMMYLTGIRRKIFDEHIPELSEKYETYDDNASAHLIRDLCIVRTSLIRNFKDIKRCLYYNVNTLETIPEYVPHDSVIDLEQEGITFPGGKPDVCKYIIKLNDEICRHINDVRSLFPDWINWDYVRALFVMPNGFNKDRVQSAVSTYNSDRNRYPFQAWINWKYKGYGNIFKNDYKFVTTLYDVNNDEFVDLNLITGTKDSMLVSLYDFIREHKKVLVAVDCENSDPVKLASVLLSLDKSLLSAVYKVILFDSDNTTPAWDTLCGTQVMKELSVSHITVDKLYSHKSQVDMDLALEVMREVLQNEVDAIILATSDSDYWTLIKNTPESDFLVLLEEMKSGNTIRDTLKNAGYHYCFIDDFCTSRAYSIKTDTIKELIQKKVNERVDFNLKDMLISLAKECRFSLTDKEIDNIFERYLKKMTFKVQADGTVKETIEGY